MKRLPTDYHPLETARHGNTFSEIDTEIKVQVEQFRNGNLAATDALYYLARERALLIQR